MKRNEERKQFQSVLNMEDTKMNMKEMKKKKQFQSVLNMEDTKMKKKSSSQSAFEHETHQKEEKVVSKVFLNTFETISWRRTVLCFLNPPL